MSKKTRDVMLGHADEADGIEEYDNPLPDWWTGLFWLTIVFAIAYTAHYHFIAERSQVKELAAEMAAARSAGRSRPRRPRWSSPPSAWRRAGRSTPPPAPPATARTRRAASART